MTMTQTRRQFLTTLSLAGVAGLASTPRAKAGEGAPEITSVTLAKTRALCTAPQLVADELLHAEGFIEIRRVETTAPEVPSAVGAGKRGIGQEPAATLDRHGTPP